MTDPKPTVPAIFGREMALQAAPGSPLYGLQIGRAYACVYQRWQRDGQWVPTLSDCDLELEYRTFETAQEAADHLGRKLHELILDAAPLLDDAAKREVVKAMGLEQTCLSCLVETAPPGDAGVRR